MIEQIGCFTDVDQVQAVKCFDTPDPNRHLRGEGSARQDFWESQKSKSGVGVVLPSNGHRSGLEGKYYQTSFKFFWAHHSRSSKKLVSPEALFLASVWKRDAKPCNTGVADKPYLTA